MITTSIWIVIGGVFILGLIIGIIIADCCHAMFTNAAWKAVQYLADQNVELVKTLKEKEGNPPWTEEGEEWKS